MDWMLRETNHKRRQSARGPHAGHPAAAILSPHNFSPLKAEPATSLTLVGELGVRGRCCNALAKARYTEAGHGEDPPSAQQRRRRVPRHLTPWSLEN